MRTLPYIFCFILVIALFYILRQYPVEAFVPAPKFPIGEFTYEYMLKNNTIREQNDYLQKVTIFRDSSSSGKTPLPQPKRVNGTLLA